MLRHLAGGKKMKVFLIIAVLIIVAFFVYFLIKASDECEKLGKQVESMQLKIASLEASKEFILHTAKEANKGVSNALVQLCAMGSLDEYNKVHHTAAQNELMEAHKKLENL